MSSRSNDRVSRQNALQELRRSRAGGKRVLKEDDGQIYDEISEAQYTKIVRNRLLQDDFVVEDGSGNSGYVDNGQDDWLEEGMNASDQESDSETRKSSKKTSKAKATKAKATKPVAPPPAAPSINAYRPKVSAAQEEDFMANLLGALDNAPPPMPLARKRKTSPQPSSDIDSSPVKASTRFHYDEDDFTSPKKRPRTSAGTSDAGMTLTIDGMADLEFNTDSDGLSAAEVDYDSFFEDDFDMDVDENGDFATVKSEPEVISLPRRAVKTVPTPKKEEDVKPRWLSVHESLNVAKEEDLGTLLQPSSSSKSVNIDALESDGTLRFFWLDYLEHDGRLYLVGKLQDKKSKTWVSCCVTIEGLQRNLYALPRERRVELDEEGNEIETDVIPEESDVYGDFDLIRKELKVKNFKAKFVERSYVFGDKDITREKTKWLKVVYPFTEPVLPMEACSPNIAKILGTNTGAFEIFVLKRKIMGPCWLVVKNPLIEFKGVSWCRFEATVVNPKDINSLSETDDQSKEIPPLTVMSLSVRTVVNHDENKREVVCASARTWHTMQIDDATPPEKLPCTVQTFIRPLDRFPLHFEAKAKANTRGTISPMQNERMLLSLLLGAINKSDPDVVIGHDFAGVSLDVLLHRMRDLKVDHWSRIGRFRRSKWPSIGKQGANVKFLNGRMLCDLASDSARSMISSTTWSLTEMCGTHLGLERQDIDPDDTANYLDGSLSGPDKMLNFVRHCELDAHYQMAIASKVQILPLTKQLTNLAGNAWNKTLNGGRAERNEYILLHEFHRLKYICPDKTFGKKSPPPKVVVEEGGEGTKAVKVKRDKYKGGLVFEPKRGLWDNYILVMDFNSLYPSIIQEYNIDFTTVDPADEEMDGEEKIPEPPSSEVPQGVLPRLISTLVQRRRVVKALMKDKSATPAKLLQYDIKQQALKLTANSMYGCLGFEYSRFYARPLAALTTFKGREILTHTRELAESLNLDVVYGDTDSVFVNSGVTDFAEALKISAMFKKAVNDRYRLLEIDLDGVFKRLLLLQKKKYAAIKVEDGERTSTEIKGLDMKRREYCVLSKNVSQYILDRILSGENTEVVVESIHEYLTTVSENVRSGQTKLEDFIINKRLGKNPQDYPDAKSQPHVQVALRIKAKGGSARIGDVIPYVFCLSEGEESAKSAQADRAKSPDEIKRSDNKLQVDYEYYLSNQILPPIERLCGEIKGTDRSRLAECLGLDPNRYRSLATSDEKEFFALDSQMSDSMRYKDASPLHVRCKSCQTTNEVPIIPNRTKPFLKASGFTCLSCEKAISYVSIQLQLEAQIREYIGKYYEGWTICDDETCHNRTRMMGVYGKRCLRYPVGCRGHVSFEYSDTQLYNQLRYFSYLFDGERAIKATKGSSSEEEVTALVGKNASHLRTLGGCVEKHLEHCGRRWVDLQSIFSVLKLT